MMFTFVIAQLTSKDTEKNSKFKIQNSKLSVDGRRSTVVIQPIVNNFLAGAQLLGTKVVIFVAELAFGCRRALRVYFVVVLFRLRTVVGRRSTKKKDYEKEKQ